MFFNRHSVIERLHISGETAHLKVAQYSLSSEISQYFTTSVGAWPSVTNAVATTETTTGYSNVDITTPSQTSWDQLTGVYSQYYTAFTMFTTTDNIQVIGDADKLKSTTRVIKYALIYFNPEELFLGTNMHKKATIVHELGHVLGLGHTNEGPNSLNVSSIMNQNQSFTYFLPQNHDIVDIEAKY